MFPEGRDLAVMQEALFYSFSLEDHVPADHLLRSIGRFVDLAGIREHLRPNYSETGRPSIDPKLMIRMLIIGYWPEHPVGAPAVREAPTSPIAGSAGWALMARSPITRPSRRTGMAGSATATCYAIYSR